MPEQPETHAVSPAPDREQTRLAASNRTTALLLAAAAVGFGSVLLLLAWTTGLAADRSVWARLVVGVLAFGAVAVLTWSLTAALGGQTWASVSLVEPGFLFPRLPTTLSLGPGGSSAWGGQFEVRWLRRAVEETARSLGAVEAYFPRPRGYILVATSRDELAGMAGRPVITSTVGPAGPWLLIPAESLPPYPQAENRRLDPDGPPDEPRDVLVIPAVHASELLTLRNHWVARAWLAAAGQRVLVGALLVSATVVLLAVSRPLPSARASDRTSDRGAAQAGASTTRGQPTATTPTTGRPTPLYQPMLANVVTGIVPVLTDAVAEPLAELATGVAATPADLKKLALENAVAPFVKSGSTNLGESLGSAIARWTGLTPSTQPVPPSKEATSQVQTTLQKALEDQLRSRPEVISAANKAGSTPEQLARELAITIAQGLATDMAQSLSRIPPSQTLDDPLVATIARGSAEQLAGRTRPPSEVQPPTTGPPPSPGRSYRVQRSDSLWGIAQRLLGSRATPREVDQAWRAIYRTNRATIGSDPDHLVPGQLLHIPNSLLPASNRGLIVPLLVSPGVAAAFAARWRRRADRGRSRLKHPVARSSLP